MLSYGKEYTLQLPTRPEGWSITAPAPERVGSVLTEEGAFVRADFGPAGQG